MSTQDIREVSVKSYYAAYLARRHDIQQLLSDVIRYIQQYPLVSDEACLSAAVIAANGRFPFVRLVYLLNERGWQISNNIMVADDRQILIDRVSGQDRSQRPYFDETVNGIIITEPYLSLVDGEVCVSASFPCLQSDETTHRAVVDCNLTEVMSYLNRDMF